MRTLLFTWSFAISALWLAGCDNTGTLVVVVRTDLVPGVDFASVEVIVTGGTEPERRFERAARADRSWGGGVRVAEGSLPSGDYRARIEAVDVSGAPVVSRPVRFEVRGGQLRVITAILTRDCRGVECPLVGEDASLAACLAGHCVPEGCTEETPELCGEPECATAAECGLDLMSSCVSRECTLSGACVELLDHEACTEPSTICSPIGCVPEAGGELSPPGPGHVHIVALGPGASLYRTEISAGAALQSVGPLLDPIFARSGDPEDKSIGLSDDGEWMSAIMRRDGCACLFVSPVRDLGAGELLHGVSVDNVGGTDVASGGRRLVFVEGDEIQLLTRESSGWVLAPTPLSAASTFTFHDHPSLTADEERVLFVCGDAPENRGAGVCEVGLDGAGLRVLVPPDTFPDQPVGSPRALRDGSAFFEVEVPSGVVELWRVSPDGSVLELLDLPGAREEACQLADGRMVAHATGALEVSRLGGAVEFTIDLDFPPEHWTWFVSACGR